MSKLHQDVYLQARSNAFQLQSLPSQNHLGAAGAQRHHEAGVMLPLWAVWTHENTSTKSEPDKLDLKAPLATLWPPEGLGETMSSEGRSYSSEGNWWWKPGLSNEESWSDLSTWIEGIVNEWVMTQHNVVDVFFSSCISEWKSARELPERSSRQFVAMTTQGVFLVDSNHRSHTHPSEVPNGRI